MHRVESSLDWLFGARVQEKSHDDETVQLRTVLAQLGAIQDHLGIDAKMVEVHHHTPPFA